jgi:serine/threonine-protein kinase
MGTVWEAEDHVLKRRVAVKILAQPLCGNPNIAARFEREAQAAGRLTHPNIAQVFDYGQDDACPYIVLELIPGSTLRQLLEARGRLPAGETAAIGAQIAAALSSAQVEGVVHRDVKPGNIMVAPDGRVKVMDFGIAEAVWLEPITDTGTIMATAKYISPERATGGGATPASDVYSTGVVLYELLAGHPPFDGDSPFAIAHAHAYDVPPPLEAAAPNVPGELRETIESAMRKDPRERPSAADLAAALGVAVPEGASVLPFPGTHPSDRTLTLLARVDGGLGASEDSPSRSRRAAPWVVAGMAVLAVLLTLALTAFSSAGVRRQPSGRDTRPAASSTAGAGSGAGTDEATAGGGSQGEPDGNAYGHDPAHRGGHGDESHGNDD